MPNSPPAGDIVVSSSVTPTSPAVDEDIFAPALALDLPKNRPLSVYAFDPSAGRLLGNEMVLTVRYEPLKPGPLGERFAVIDYDGGQKTLYSPVNLDDPVLLLRGGLEPTESDPRFHQQMVYAVATATLERFEAALGREVHWRHPSGGSLVHSKDAGQRNRLGLFPHAFAQANAFYSPALHGILFGYFKAGTRNPGANLPGETVFTCLSHDIVAHETTHAIIDGIRSYLTEPTNLDVPAFHEAFADLAALFRHFSQSDVLLDTLQRTGGRLFDFEMRRNAPGGGQAVIQGQVARANPLIELAQQFGEASGIRSGLRSALDTPASAADIRKKTEPHARGSILVSAVFDAFFTTYLTRTAQLFRVYRAGGGAANPVDLPGPLAALLAMSVSRTADSFFALCARALDYLPPVDITFGDFLRALVTAHRDFHPDDPDGERDALMQAFRLRGIVAEDARFFSEDALCWPPVAGDRLPPVEGLCFGSPSGLDQGEKERNAKILGEYAQRHAKLLKFDPDLGHIAVPSFHPMFRTDRDGRLCVDMVVELVQTRLAPFQTGNRCALGQFPMRSGVTLLIAEQPVRAGRRAAPQVRYAIGKHYTPEREFCQRAYYAASPYAVRVDAGEEHDRYRINFGLVHGGL
jgi:hypothetical protein